MSYASVLWRGPGPSVAQNGHTRVVDWLLDIDDVAHGQGPHVSLSYTSECAVAEPAPPCSKNCSFAPRPLRNQRSPPSLRKSISKKFNNS